MCFFSTVYIGEGGTVKKRHKFSLPRKYKLAAARVFIFFSFEVEKVISSMLFSYLISEICTALTAIFAGVLIGKYLQEEN